MVGCNISVVKRGVKPAPKSALNKDGKYTEAYKRKEAEEAFNVFVENTKLEGVTRQDLFEKHSLYTLTKDKPYQARELDDWLIQYFKQDLIDLEEKLGFSICPQNSYYSEGLERETFIPRPDLDAVFKRAYDYGYKSGKAMEKDLRDSYYKSKELRRFKTDCFRRGFNPYGDDPIPPEVQLVVKYPSGEEGFEIISCNISKVDLIDRNGRKLSFDVPQIEEKPKKSTQG